MKRKIQVWQYFHGVTEHCFWWKLIILFYFMSTIILLLSLSVYANCRDPPPCFKKMHYSSNLESSILFSLVQGKQKNWPICQLSIRDCITTNNLQLLIEREREPHYCLVVCVKIIFFTKKYANSLHILVQNVGKKKAQKITILWMVAHFKF